jgi:CO dehydrogenase maturation factor
LKEGEFLVMDMEAGVESFGRGVERQVDTILAVVEPSLESIIVAGRIAQMAQGMGISRAGAIINKVSSAGISARTKEELEKRDVKIYGVLSYSALLADTAFEGQAVSDCNAVEEARSIIKNINIRSSSACNNAKPCCPAVALS